ncbi:hypothetical protein [Roseibium sp. RKSG952]|uniref:hypothetical protein n=1 Tax=Roseibium sp. RKSG952 TaxID=2529384 RepID=UPI0012BBF306|nr:hypothetical protein [Roseibium sp. RKSG952]MTH98172.1 hypothetical protein [Roseibium sp. RKSG952]
MNASQLAASLIRRGGRTVIAAAHQLEDEEFFETAKTGPSMAWTLLHLCGQLEWAVQQTTGAKSRADVDLLERFKGEDTLEQAAELRGIMPERLEIVAMYEQSLERALGTLESHGSKWETDPQSESVKQAFATTGEIWQTVSWHAFWHLGQLSATQPALGGSRYTQPGGFLGQLC